MYRKRRARGKFTASALELTGAQHLRRSRLLMLRVRVEQPVMFFRHLLERLQTALCSQEREKLGEQPFAGTQRRQHDLVGGKTYRGLLGKDGNNAAPSPFPQGVPTMCDFSPLQAQQIAARNTCAKEL